MADPAEQITETDITGNDELALIRQERDALARERQSTGQLRSAVVPTAKPTPDLVTQAGQSALTDLERLRKVQEGEQGLYKQREGALAPLRERILAELDRQEREQPQPPGAPRPPPIPTRAQSIDQTAAKSLFAIASFIGALGMAGGRGRGMLAMAGMRGAIEGFREGNAEKYKDSLAQYKAAVDEQLNQYEMQYKSYLAILKQGGLSLDRKLMAYDLEAARYQDQIGASAAQQKDIGAMIKHADEIAKTAATLRDRSEHDLQQMKLGELHVEGARIGIKEKEEQLKIIQERGKQLREKQAKNAAEKSKLDKALSGLRKSRDQIDKEIKEAHWWTDTSGLRERKAEVAKRIQEGEDRMFKLEMGADLASADEDNDPLKIR